MSRLRRLGTWYSEADLHRLILLLMIILSNIASLVKTITICIMQAATAEEAFNQKEISPLSR